MGATGGTYSAGSGHFTSLVKQFPPRLKQAIVGAAQHGLLVRGSWNGCVFNAAGSEVGAYVRSYDVAAAVFDLPQDVVAKFIRRWDLFPGSDVGANLELIQSIKEVGLFSEPTTGPLAKRTSAIRGYVVKHVFKSELDALNEEFQAMAENVDITRPADQRSQLERDICELVAAL